MNLKEVLVRPVLRLEEKRYKELMQEFHYLGSLPKISETLWYVATCCDECIALISFSLPHGNVKPGIIGLDGTSVINMIG